MRIIAFTTSWWSNPDEARKAGEGQFGLAAWVHRVGMIFNPDHWFIACGTYSNPIWCPVPSATVVNAGIHSDIPYDFHYQQYSLCAMTAAMAYALNREDWDFLVNLDTDCLIGDIDMESLLSEFMQRPETLLTPAWYDNPSGPLMVFKREGAVTFQYRKIRSDLIARSSPAPTEPPMCPEGATKLMFGNDWWNPWPQFKTVRQDWRNGISAYSDAEVLTWPMVRMPDPAIVERYLAECSVKTRPVR